MFPFSPQDLVIGNKSGIGLCTLWTPKNRYLAQLADVEVIGNLYSRFGIGILIRNVLSTPSVRNIVITGVDNPEPKRHQALALLSGEFDPQELYLDHSHVEEFYRRTALYDARKISLKHQGELTQFIRSLPLSAAGSLEPIIVPLPEVSQEVYPSARSGYMFRAASIKDAHYAILREIRMFGQYTPPDSEGHRRQELWQVMVCLAQDCSLDNIPLYDHDEVLRYGEYLWHGNDPGDLTYSYGHTLRYKYGDQVQAALEAFKKKPETFRTVLSLWEPLQSMLRDDEPCLITIHPRVRNGTLDMYAYIRTNEMFRAWPKNAAGLRYFQTMFAQELSVAVGELTISSGSAHIYDYDWPTIDTHLSRTKQPGLAFDPKGDWRFTRSSDEFVAEHYYEERLLQRFSERSIERLEKRVLPFIHDISHALYIGREIAKLQYENT
ncbi:MAG: thymidylate synthase [Roseiflexaceae bacterium]